MAIENPLALVEATELAISVQGVSTRSVRVRKYLTLHAYTNINEGGYLPFLPSRGGTEP